MAREWARGIQLGDEAAARHASHLHRIRYEDLVSDPAAAVADLYARIGIEYDPDMLDIHQTAADSVVEGQADCFRQIWNGINQARSASGVAR